MSQPLPKITNRSSLRDNVAGFAHSRNMVIENWETIIQQAEARMNTDIFIKEIELSVNGTLSDPIIAIPSDKNQFQRLVLTGSNGEECHLPYEPPSATDFKTRSTGSPRSFHVADQVIVVTPSPSAPMEYTLFYIPDFRPLVNSTDTNYILERWPHIYLHCCLGIVGMLQKDKETMAIHFAEYRDAGKRAKSRSRASLISEEQPMRKRVRGARIGRQ